jgi:hypothetical protein
LPVEDECPYPMTSVTKPEERGGPKTGSTEFVAGEYQLT